MSGSASDRRGGTPSTTTPIAGPWLSPQVVKRNRVPNELPAMAASRSSFPRKRESRANALQDALDPRLRACERIRKRLDQRHASLYLMLRSALGRVSKHATTPMQRLLALRGQFFHTLFRGGDVLQVDITYAISVQTLTVNDDVAIARHVSFGVIECRVNLHAVRRNRADGRCKPTLHGPAALDAWQATVAARADRPRPGS